MNSNETFFFAENNRNTVCTLYIVEKVYSKRLLYKIQMKNRALQRGKICNICKNLQ